MKCACRCTYTCVRWSVHFQTFIQLWVTISNCAYAWTHAHNLHVIMMHDHDDQTPSCMHTCEGMFVCGLLLTHKQRCISMQTSMHTSMHVWTHAGTLSLMWMWLYPLPCKTVISAYFTMIYHDDQNSSCMHACKGMFVCGWLLTHKQRFTSMQTSMHTSMHVWTHPRT